MTRTLTHRIVPVVTAAILAAGAAALEPDWTILKPSNTGIPGDNVYDIFVDGAGNPWIPGFITFWEEGGMARWDKATDTWFSLTNVDYPTIASPRFNDIDADASGIMWIGTEHGLLRYDPVAGPATMVRYDDANTPMPGHQVEMVSIAPDGTVWLAMHNHGEVPVGGLVQYDPAGDTWNVWTTANGLPWGAEWPGWDWIDYAAAAPDDDGGYTVYFGSMEMGAATYKNGIFRRIVDHPLSNDPLILGVSSDDPVDNVGHAWLSSDEGLVRRDPDGSMTIVPLPPGTTGRVEAFADGRIGLINFTGSVWVYDNGWTALGPWGGGTGYALAEESPGVYWAGGNTGVARYAEGSWQRYRLTNTGMLGYWVETIDFDAAGNVYMDGNAGPGVGGFTIYDGERWTCVNDFNYGLGPVWGQPSDHVDVLCLRSNGTMALDVGVQGLQEWDGASYSSLNGQYNTFGLVEDMLGRLWSGNWGRLFLYEGGDMTLFDETNSPMPVLEVETIVADPVNPGFVWVATGVAIAHTDGTTWEVYPREMLDLDQNSTGWFINCAEPAGDGTLWVGSGRGLYHFDTVTLSYDVYTPANSALPSDDIDHLEVTPDGSIWATTFDMTFPYPGGLTRFDGQSWQTWTMTDSPLPHNQVWELTSRETATGYEVWVGTASEGVAVLGIEVQPTGSCPDTDGNGIVDVDDIVNVVLDFGSSGLGHGGDVDGSGLVDIDDVVMVVLRFGDACP